MTRRFGFNQDFETLNESEASALRKAAEVFLTKRNFSAVSCWLNEEGYRTTLGGLWQKGPLSRLLSNPAIAGLAYGPDGRLVETGLPAAIGRETFEEIQRVRPRRSAPAMPPARAYPLADGVFDCGMCGTDLTGSWLTAKQQARYICRPGGTGCGQVSVTADLLERYVDELATDQLARTDVQAGLADVRDSLTRHAGTLRLQITQINHELTDLSSAYRQGLVSAAEYQTTVRKAQCEYDALALEADLTDELDVLPPAGGWEVPTSWRRVPEAHRRAVLILLFEALQLFPVISRRPADARLDQRVRAIPRRP